MLTATLPLPDRLAWIVELLCKAIAAEGCKRRMEGPLVVAIWKRVRNLGRRFASLVASWRAGELRPPSAARPRPASARPATPSRPAASLPAASLPAASLPRAFAWMHRLLPDSAPGSAGMLDSLLRNDAEMQAFVAAVPQAGRILRPLCHMLGIRPPPYLALPRRPRVRKKPPPRPAAREREKKPVDVTKLSPLAFANLIHPEREPMGFRPPNRIGYARPRPLPRDYRPRSKNWE